MPEINYVFTSKDLRSAMYYPHLIRNRKIITITKIALIIAGGCFLAAEAGMVQHFGFVYLIAVAYLIYFIIVCARAEVYMKRYMRTPDCLVGKKFICTLDKKSARFRLPESNINETVPWKTFDLVVDMKNIFLFCFKGDQVYTVPKRAFTGEQLEQATALIQQGVGDRFTVYRLFRTNK